MAIPHFVLDAGVVQIEEKKGEGHLTITLLDENRTVDGAETRVVEQRDIRKVPLAAIPGKCAAKCNRTQSAFQEGAWLGKGGGFNGG